MLGASGFVFPSLYEGFGLPPLEAMAAGIPVAASNTSAIPEVCGDCAIYFNPYDESSIAAALVRLAGLSGQEKQSYVEKGRQRAKDFHLEQNSFATDRRLSRGNTVRLKAECAVFREGGFEPDWEGHGQFTWKKT